MLLMSPDPNHPTLAVSACIWHGGRVLMIKRGRSPGKNLWSLPGGRVEFGEKLIDAARRERHEETGVEAGALSLVDFVEYIPRRDKHYVLAVFTGLWHAGTPLAAGDAAEANWLIPGEFGGLALTDNLETIIAKAANLIAKDA